MNLYKVRQAQDEGGQLFRAVQRQKDQYQGLWIVSPEGKVIAGHHNIKSHETWTQEVIDTIDDGLKTFGAVTTRDIARENPLPYRGVGVQPDGSVGLAVYARYVHDGRRDGPVVIDTLTLSADEWSQLTPTRINESAEWTIAEATARKFCRLLSPNSDQSTMPKPDEVTAVRMSGSVAAIKDNVATIVFTGQIAATHSSENRLSRSEARLTGRGVYDVKTKRLLSLLVLSDGMYRHFPPYDASRQTGGVIEWRAKDTT